MNYLNRRRSDFIEQQLVEWTTRLEHECTGLRIGIAAAKSRLVEIEDGRQTDDPANRADWDRLEAGEVEQIRRAERYLHSAETELRDAHCQLAQVRLTRAIAAGAKQ